MNGPKTIRTAIVDDEPLARRTLRLLLSSDPTIDVIAECANGTDALDVLNSDHVELLFLDIQMPGISGLEVLRKVNPARMPVVVFVTAHDQYAVGAFESGALDYLLKPFNDRRFQVTMERIKTVFQTNRAADLARRVTALLQDDSLRGPFVRRFAVRHGGKTTFVDASEVIWIEAADYNVRIHTDNGTIVARESLEALEEQLGESFLRVHRRALVSVDRVKQVRGLECVLSDGSIVNISRARRMATHRRLRKT